MFVNMTAAYDTVWHCGLTCKLLRLLPNKHMVQMIIELVWNRSFALTTDDSKPSGLRRLKNDLPQESVLTPLLFNIYIYNLSSITSKKYAYADDLAILYSSGHWKVLERTLSEHMTTRLAYLQTWQLSAQVDLLLFFPIRKPDVLLQVLSVVAFSLSDIAGVRHYCCIPKLKTML